MKLADINVSSGEKNQDFAGPAVSSRFAPLRGVRIVDLSRVLAGPICSMILADLGADVIKVERPGSGDDTRAWGPPFVREPASLAGMSAYFASVNRNKRSLSLDLARPEGREILLKLVARSQAVIENFLPSSAAKLGLSPEDLHAVNPELIVCSISGFGRTGPWREQPGYDFVVQALSGLMSITGEPEGEPMKVGVALSDVLTGLYAAVSLVASLYGASRSVETTRSPDAGRPARSSDGPIHLDLSLLDCTLASLVNVAQAYLVTGERPVRYGNAHAQIVPYECFPTADGYIVLAIGNDEQYRRFCSAAQRNDLATDSRFTTNPQRVTHRVALIADLKRVLRGRTTGEWQRLLADAGVPHAPVHTLDEALALPQVQSRQMAIDAIGGLRLLASPIRATGTEPQAPTPPPRLGEHSEPILAEFGYSSAEIAALRANGII